MKRVQFEETHPFPDKSGVDRLYKFKRLDTERPECLSSILIDARLYHPLPNELNDPWEAQAAILPPSTAGGAVAARARLKREARLGGHPRDQLNKYATGLLGNRKRFAEILLEAFNQDQARFRLCSFSAVLDNKLLWSHYGESHQGIAIEFDAQASPLSFAYKVKYSDEYPTMEYPFTNYEILSSVLIKSKDWNYEEEFRSIIVLDSETQFPNDGQSAILGPQAITGIYFGARIPAAEKDQITQMVLDGPFTPRMFQARPSRTTYAIEYDEIA